MNNIETMLFENRDIKYRDFNSALIPSVPVERVIGVRIPVLRKMGKELYREDKPYVKVFLESTPHKYLEENHLHSIFIMEEKDFCKALDLTEKFMPHIDNWQTCDILRPKVFFKNKEVLREFALEKINSSHEYTARFAIGLLHYYFLKEDFEPYMLNEVMKADSSYYYVEMMQAWYYCEALYYHFDEVFSLLESGKLKASLQNRTVRKVCESSKFSSNIKNTVRSLKK